MYSGRPDREIPDAFVPPGANGRLTERAGIEGAVSGAGLNFRDNVPNPVDVEVRTMDIHLATDDTELDAIADVMLELRTSYTKASLIARMREQMQQGYRVAWVEADGEVLCVAGFVVGLKLAWGRHVYVDDLVTAARRRSAGAGAAMIAWLKTYARELGCRELHLDSGVQRFAAHRFYLRERFNIESHHFSLKMLD